MIQFRIQVGEYFRLQLRDLGMEKPKSKHLKKHSMGGNGITVYVTVSKHLTGPLLVALKAIAREILPGKLTISKDGSHY